jgi:hypothetical protein
MRNLNRSRNPLKRIDSYAARIGRLGQCRRRYEFLGRIANFEAIFPAAFFKARNVLQPMLAGTPPRSLVERFRYPGRPVALDLRLRLRGNRLGLAADSVSLDQETVRVGRD